jgi:hypothetical protein
MKYAAILGWLVFASFVLSGCEGQPAFIYSISADRFSAEKQVAIRESFISLAEEYNLRDDTYKSSYDPSQIGFSGVPRRMGTTADSRDHSVAFSYSPRNRVIVVTQFYGTEEYESTKSFRNAVEGMLTQVVGPDGFSISTSRAPRPLSG